MDIISLSKASKALREIQKIDKQTVAPGAESHFVNVDARIDWMESQAAVSKANRLIDIILSQGAFDKTEYVDRKIQLKSIIGNLYNYQKYSQLIQYTLSNFIYSSTDTMTVKGNTSYSFDQNTGAVALGGSYITLGTGAGQTVQGTVYTFTGGILYQHVSTWSGTVSSWKHTINKATISQLPTSQKGNLVETVMGLNYQYPENGMASDGYWYVKEELAALYTASGTWESPIIDLSDGYLETLSLTHIKKGFNADDKFEIRYGDTPTTLSTYEPFITQVPQARYVQFKAYLKGTASTASTKKVELNDESLALTQNAYVKNDGDLSLIRNYPFDSSLVSQETDGTIYTTDLRQVDLKKINTIRLK